MRVKSPCSRFLEYRQHAPSYDVTIQGSQSYLPKHTEILDRRSCISSRGGQHIESAGYYLYHPDHQAYKQCRSDPHSVQQQEPYPMMIGASHRGWRGGHRQSACATFESRYRGLQDSTISPFSPQSSIQRNVYVQSGAQGL